MALSASVADPVDNTIINPAMVLSHKYPEVKFEYDERDVALYALTVGACSSDLADEKELQLVYHRDGQSCIKVLPTFVSLFTTKYNNELVLDVPGLHYDPKLLVHGQQYIEIYGPIPSRANVTNKIKVAGLHDRGKAAVLELEILSYLEGSCELLCMNRSSFYLRGAGGFSDSSRPFSYTTYPANEVSPVAFPDSKPSAVQEDRTQKSQALLCGISSYFDPLHSDPIAAQEAGFSHPILPGLGTLGFVIRTVLRSSNTESTNVKSISCRFLHHVYPGETLVSEMWFRGQRVYYKTKVKERGRAVLSGYVLLNHIPSLL
ncbi:hypothetical protein QOZ80_6BG0481400 [Eleusine coracana subsp. coracana]|nr:hypothetical protein QOZ80_6BG0481400 [Eleusine coracana subsp. coracana]